MVHSVLGLKRVFRDVVQEILLFDFNSRKAYEYSNEYQYAPCSRASLLQGPSLTSSCVCVPLSLLRSCMRKTILLFLFVSSVSSCYSTFLQTNQVAAPSSSFSGIVILCCPRYVTASSSLTELSPCKKTCYLTLDDVCLPSSRPPPFQSPSPEPTAFSAA